MKIKMTLKMRNRSHRFDTNRLALNMDTNILNIKCV